MFSKTFILLGVYICSAFAAPTPALTPAPNSVAVLNSRDTQWSITGFTRDCGTLWLKKCDYSFVIHDDTGTHQCTISDKGYALDSWGPTLCAENYDGLVNISWSYKVGSGTLKVVFGPIPGISPPVSDYATFKYDYPNLHKSFPDKTGAVSQTS